MWNFCVKKKKAIEFRLIKVFSNLSIAEIYMNGDFIVFTIKKTIVKKKLDKVIQ